IGPVVGTIGNLQALAVIQRISTGEFQVATHQLKLFDGQTMNWQNLSVTQDSECPVCCTSTVNYLEEETQ
ncbi:molybdopterin-synthase adenylyltransferase MoeB, partial [Vibrio splendidus]